jgi:glucose-6-phosphate-specific signal transduction histidine kinase
LGCFWLANLSAFAASAETSQLQSGTWGVGWLGVALALVVGAAILGRKRLDLRSSRAPVLAEALSRIPRESGCGESGRQPGFRVSSEGSDNWLDPAIEEEIYRIGREAVLNAFRHSQAKNIEVTLAFRSKSLKLVVRDDGRGIAPDVVTGSRDLFRGLSLMRDRAERMGGRLRLRSASRRGTELEFLLPGAFSNSASTVVSASALSMRS